MERKAVFVFSLFHDDCGHGCTIITESEIMLKPLYCPRCGAGPDDPFPISVTKMDGDHDLFVLTRPVESREPVEHCGPETIDEEEWGDDA